MTLQIGSNKRKEIKGIGFCSKPNALKNQLMPEGNVYGGYLLDAVAQNLFQQISPEFMIITQLNQQLTAPFRIAM
jgi:hypothetical protein